MANKQAANTIFTTITCEVCGRPVRAKRWVPDPCTCECGAVYTSGEGWLCGTTNPNTEAMHRILTDAPVKWTKPKRGATYAESEDQPYFVVEHETLSDGSHMHNVVWTVEDRLYGRFFCYDSQHAKDLAASLDRCVGWDFPALEAQKAADFLPPCCPVRRFVLRKRGCNRMDNNKMIPQHVPGPWTINPDFRKDCEQNYHIESQQGTVCFCSTGWPDDGIAEANANLIAAAPELLACCKALVKAIEEEAYIEGWDTALYSSLVDARVAILKAEGQTPKRD